MSLIATQVLLSHNNQLFAFPGTPEPEVDWYKDNRVIREGGRIKFMFEDDGLCSLLVRDAESSDRGRYKCVASNPLERFNVVLSSSLSVSWNFFTLAVRRYSNEENVTSCFR